MKPGLEDIARADGRYPPQALSFVYEGLGYTVKKHARNSPEPTAPHHITGRDLANGLKDLALERYGKLAPAVLAGWGIRSTRDFGEIVYLMIAHQWMTAQPTDTIEDFNDVYPFTDFDKDFRF